MTFKKIYDYAMSMLRQIATMLHPTDGVTLTDSAIRVVLICYTCRLVYLDTRNKFLCEKLELCVFPLMYGYYCTKKTL